MADQHSSDDLSPSLQAVLSSLSVNLEDELNRYRRNRLTYSSPADDVFADLEDAVFTETDAVEPAITVPITLPTVSVSSVPVYPPALPPNKRLSASVSTGVSASVSTGVSASVPTHVPTTASAAIASVSAAKVETPMNEAPINVSTAPSELLARVSTREAAFLGGRSAEAAPVASEMSDRAREAEIAAATISSITSGSHLSSDYLASSEKLIESLSEVPPMPEPVDITFKPRRKAVSLLAGATLGLFGLIAGLAASYLMSNPTVVQRLANGFKREPAVVATPAKDTFDPPGPDLSAQEFVDIDIDNLSSLNMSQTAINPSSVAAYNTSTTALPPISGQLNASPNSQSSGAQTATPPGSALPTATQAAVIPAGSHYYVTVPFTTEQGLADLRQSVAEAFVRQFSKGNLVQLAAFDNPAAAQQFIEELKAKGVVAQLYGPTTE